MANQLENSDLVIQLPWAVPQQPLVQTASVVENSNRKMELNLNHSTDTTAISSFEQSAKVAVSSFDYATGVAVFLALCATGLAYWFGVRSFVLTKRSFDVVLEQITSSRIEAENNSKITIEQIHASIESNKELSKNQLEIIFKDMHFKRTLSIFENLRNEFSTFFSLLDDEILKTFNFRDRFNEQFRGGLHIRHALIQPERYPEIYKEYMDLKNKRFILRNAMEKIIILLDQEDATQLDIYNQLETIFEGYDKISFAVLDGQRLEQKFIDDFRQDCRILKTAVSKLMSSEIQKLSTNAI